MIEYAFINQESKELILQQYLQGESIIIRKYIAVTER